MGTLTVSSSEVPFTTSGGNFQGPKIAISDPALASCRIVSMQVQVAATAADLTALGDDWVLRFDREGGPLGFDLIRMPGFAPLRGTQLGTECSNLQFVNLGANFGAQIPPPYNGNFRPRGVANPTSPGTFFEYQNTGARGTYGLYPAFIDAPMTITCFTIQMSLGNVF